MPTLSGLLKQIVSRYAERQRYCLCLLGLEKGFFNVGMQCCCGCRCCAPADTMCWCPPDVRLPLVQRCGFRLQV